MTLLLLSWAARAVDAPALDAQLFRPSPDATHTLWVQDTTPLPLGAFTGRVLSHYTRDPLAYVREDGQVERVVGDVATTSLLGAIGLGPARFGLDLPVLMRSGSEVVGGETGLGDIGLDLKGTLLERTASRVVGVGLQGRLTFPTSTVSASLGQAGVGWELGALLDARPVPPLLLALNLGTRGQPAADLEDLAWDDQFLGRFAVAVGTRAGASLEVAGAATYASLSAPEANPVEALLGGFGEVAPGLVLRGAAGTGLTGAIGAPSLRAMVGLSFAPGSGDDDGDGVLDRADACRNQPEDRDDVLDGDGCPEPTAVVVRVVDPAGEELTDATWTVDGRTGKSGETVLLQGGSWSFQATAPGKRPRVELALVPDAAHHEVRLEVGGLPGALRVRALDAEGNPIPDALWYPVGQDERLSSGDTLQQRQGTVKVRIEAPGYRPANANASVLSGQLTEVTAVLAPARAVLEATRIDIRDSVYFETAKATIKAESHSLLDEVAQILVDHPEVRKVRIEGHTDSRGDANANRQLSLARAEAVVAYLVGKGVEPSRLDAVGFGEDRPLVQGEDESAYAKNRRVDFFVVERSD